jgi:hypothetical protein
MEGVVAGGASPPSSWDDDICDEVENAARRRPREYPDNGDSQDSARDCSAEDR